MFTMDVPYVPSHETPIVLAQADVAGSTPMPDFILNDCKETRSTGNPQSAWRAVNPAGMLRNYIQGRDNHIVELSEIKNVTLLQGATVGKITSVVDNTGRSWYRYDAPANYEGNDKAVFMAEYQGKRYKIVVELHVFEVVDESASSCPPPKLIKVTKPTSGASSYGQDYYNLASVSVTFADLPGSAVGQTVGSTITLDTNAAGHGWYVDANPLDNSEYLATSTPYEWVAKE